MTYVVRRDEDAERRDPTGAKMERWDRRFLLWSLVIAKASKDPSTQVGAVITRLDRSVASVGYNGFPRGVEDSLERLTDRRFKYPMVVHAEANAIAAAKEPLNGFTLYCTHPPCATCAGLIIQSGISRVVALEPSAAMIERWGDSFSLMRVMVEEARVGLVFYPMRDVTIQGLAEGVGFVTHGASNAP